MRMLKVIGPWAKNGLLGNYPALYDAHACHRISDATNQLSLNLPTYPNSCVLYVECSEAVLAEIEGDSVYEVLWDLESSGVGEPGRNPLEPAGAAEFGLLRAYLAREKFPQDWIKIHTDNSKPRAENARMLQVAMKELPPEPV